MNAFPNPPRSFARAALGPLVGAWVICAAACNTGRSVVSEVSPDTAQLVLEWSAPLLEDVSTVVGLAVGDEGSVYALSEDGRLLESTRGGPVEVLELPSAIRGRPRAVAALEEGALAIRTDRAVALVGADGGLVAQLEVPSSPFLWGSRSLAAGPAGQLYVGVAPPVGDRRGPEPPVFLRISAGTVRDTVRLPRRVSDRCTSGPDPHFAVGWHEDFRSRYLPQVVWSAGPRQGLVAGCPATYRLERGADQGRGTVMSIAPWRPIGISDEEREDVVTTWMTMMNNRPDGEPWRWLGDTIADRKPAFSAIVADQGPSGRVWVWPAQHSATQASHPTWPLAGLPSVVWVESGFGAFDVFEASGALRGHVALPEEVRFTPWPDTPEPVVRGDSLWAAVVDSAGLTRIARYRVTWP